jgi:hypothetical protein
VVEPPLRASAGRNRRGGHERHHSLSIREARAWTSNSSGRRRAWKPCKVCRPIDPYLLDTADTTVFYRAETSPATLINVEADDGDGTTMIQRLAPPPGSVFGWGQALVAHRANTAIGILSDATSATAAESINLPHKEFADTFPAMMADTPLRISRTEVRAWLRDWYREHPTKPAPAALTVLLDLDLALRPDPDRLSTLR